MAPGLRCYPASPSESLTSPRLASPSRCTQSQSPSPSPLRTCRVRLTPLRTRSAAGPSAAPGEVTLPLTWPVSWAHHTASSRSFLRIIPKAVRDPVTAIAPFVRGRWDKEGIDPQTVRLEDHSYLRHPSALGPSLVGESPETRRSSTVASKSSKASFSSEGRARGPTGSQTGETSSQQI